LIYQGNFSGTMKKHRHKWIGNVCDYLFCDAKRKKKRKSRK
jgi:hypothetical protein